MAAYPKEAQEEIKRLESQIKAIKSRYSRDALVDAEKVSELQKLTGTYNETYTSHVSFLARAVCSRRKEKNKKNDRTVKTLRELGDAEYASTKACFNEILDVLLKYARRRA